MKRKFYVTGSIKNGISEAQYEEVYHQMYPQDCEELDDEKGETWQDRVNDYHPCWQWEIVSIDDEAEEKDRRDIQEDVDNWFADMHDDDSGNHKLSELPEKELKEFIEDRLYRRQWSCEYDEMELLKRLGFLK